MHNINLNQLGKAFNNESPRDSWHIISDTTIGTTKTVYAGGATNTSHGFKFHISIQLNKAKEAALIIAEEINKSACPKIGIKFRAQSALTNNPNRQPGKEVALAVCGSGKEGNLTKEDVKRFYLLLANIDNRLAKANIAQDPLPFNSDKLSSKFDRVILHTEGSPSRFAYRNENAIVLYDDTYRTMAHAPRKNISKQTSNGYLVKESYFRALPQDKKHNPAEITDPFFDWTFTNAHGLVTEADTAPPATTTQLEDTAGGTMLSLTLLMSPIFRYPAACTSILAGLSIAAIIIASALTAGAVPLAAAIGTGAAVGLVAGCGTFFAVKKHIEASAEQKTNSIAPFHTSRV